MATFAEPTIPLALISERLLLRMPTEYDWRPLHAYYGDADSVRYTVGTPCTPAQTWRTLAGVVGHWAWRGYGPYTLLDKDEGGVLGVAGLWYPNDWPEPEIKWALLPAARGCGLAVEATRAVRQMAREHLPGVRLINLIAQGNEASVRVAEAAGARLEREIEWRSGRAFIYRHPD